MANFRFSPGAVVFGSILALLSGCNDDASPKVASDVPPGVIDLRVKLPVPEFGYQITSAGRIVKAGSEALICDVVRFEPQDGEKLFWMNKAESRTSDYSHHMNVHAGFFSVMDAFLSTGSGERYLGKPVGTYDCAELGDLMQEQNAFPVYPSQLTYQSVAFPPGIAIPGIAPLVMVMEHHYINTTDDDVFVNAVVNFHRMPEEDVEHILTGFAGVHDKIELPPNSGKIEAWTCAVERDINMVAISSHAHERSDCFTLNEYHAETSSIVADPFYANRDWHAPPIMKFEPGEWTLRAGDGIHWGCHYNNREDRLVTDGPGADDEMCIFVGVGYPNRMTVADIKAMITDPASVDTETLIGDAMVACTPVTAPSPYPHVGEILEKVDTCQTLDPSLITPVHKRE